jgi:transposase
MHRIGEDVAERLDVIPAAFRVIVTRRPKYGCRACESAVVQAPAPARLIEGGLPTETLVAHVLVGKYADHLPLYRQRQIYARQGIELDRSTLADWVGRAAAELQPLHERLLEHLLRSPKLFMDETRAPVLDPGRKRTKTGYLWAIARDDRPWAGPDPPAVVYLYAPGRGAEHAIRPLAGFSGILQVDAYAAYNALADPARAGGPVTLAYCWSHVRRGFYEIAQGGDAPIAEEALARIAALFGIERTIRGDPPEQRRKVRLDQTRPLVDDLRAWLEAKLAKVSGGSRIAQAIRYALKHWAGLTVFLDDGRVEIDSNTVERAIRPIATRRSLCPLPSSIWKHWDLVLGGRAIRAPTRCGVQVLPWPVRMPIRLSEAAISRSDQRPAIRAMIASASSGVRQPCSPVFGLRTRICECWPPRQWMVRMTSRAAWSTSAMISVTRARTSCWRARIVTPGALQAAARSSARPVKSGAGVALSGSTSASRRPTQASTRRSANSQARSSCAAIRRLSGSQAA